MQRDTVIRILQSHRQELFERYGVLSISLFGSVARNEATTNSDIDLLAEFGRPTGYLGLAALQQYLSQLLAAPVDVGTPGSLKPGIRRQIEKDFLRVI